MSAYSTVEHEEMASSPTEEGTSEGGASFTATVTLKTPWRKRLLLASDIVGNFSLYPQAPESGARAISASIKPFDAAVDQASGYIGMASYEYALVTIKYQLKAETGDFITESLEPAVEMMTLNHEGFRWSNKNRKWKKGDDVPPPTPILENEAPGRLCRMMEYKVTMMRMPSIPQAVVDYVDCVNDKTVTPKLLQGISFPAETLLYNPPTCSRKWNFSQWPYWEISYHFTYRASGWNKFWNNKLQDYDTMEHIDPVKPMTKKTIHTDLIDLTTYTPNWVPYKLYEAKSLEDLMVVTK
jgi:hypothetical protein